MSDFVGCPYVVNDRHHRTIKQSDTTLYDNGDIVTMQGDAPQMVEVIVEQRGKITFVGDLKAAQKQFSQAHRVDLQGRTLLPGFIDPHSHFGMVSNTMGQVNLNPPPVGSVTGIEAILSAIKAYKTEHNIADGEWIFAWGYDESQLQEQRHPNKREIDQVLPNNPVYLQHTSGHMGVANSMALERMQVTADTPNPEGGNIDRISGSNEPNGLVQETAMYPFVGNMLQILASHQAQYFEQTQDYYAKNGVTTAQDGMKDRNALAVFQSQADASKLKIDLIALAGFSDLDENQKDAELKWKTYQNGFKMQGTKIIADGSPKVKRPISPNPI